MTAHHSTVPTAAGPFTVVADPDGAVLASGWTSDVDALLPLIHPSLRPTESTGRADLGEVTRAVADYHAGDLHSIDSMANAVMQKKAA